jgi:hypothetical protein
MAYLSKILLKNPRRFLTLGALVTIMSGVTVKDWEKLMKRSAIMGSAIFGAIVVSTAATAVVVKQPVTT